MRYPEAPRLDLTEDIFGHQVSDPYRWMEDADSAERADWLRAQASVVLGGAGGLAGAGRPGRAGPGAAQRRRGGHAGLARGPVLLHQARARAGARRAVHAGRRRAGRGARRPDGHRPVRADHAGRLAAGQGGTAAGLPAVRGWRRGIPAAGAGRRDRFGGGRADRPVPVLQRGLAAGRQGLLLHAPAAGLSGPGGREPVSPAGLPAPGRHVRGRTGRAHLRYRPGQDRLLLRLGQPGRPLAVPVRVPGHGAAQRPVAGRPVLVRPLVTGPAGGAGRGGRADLGAGRAGRALLRLHRSWRAAGTDRGGRSRFGDGPGQLAGPASRGCRGGAARVRDPGRARAGAAGAAGVVDSACAERDHRARPGFRCGAGFCRIAGPGHRGRAERAAGGRARSVVRVHGLHHAAAGAAVRRAILFGADMGGGAGVGGGAGRDGATGDVPVGGRDFGADAGHQRCFRCRLASLGRRC